MCTLSLCAQVAHILFSFRLFVFFKQKTADEIGVRPVGSDMCIRDIPNILGPIAGYATLTIPQVMLLERFLSFLGLGTVSSTHMPMPTDPSG